MGCNVMASVYTSPVPYIETEQHSQHLQHLQHHYICNYDYQGPAFLQISYARLTYITLHVLCIEKDSK
jgi:hypothetical protein